jgi:hypothetical protein
VGVVVVVAVVDADLAVKVDVVVMVLLEEGFGGSVEIPYMQTMWPGLNAART